MAAPTISSVTYKDAWPQQHRQTQSFSIRSEFEQRYCNWPAHLKTGLFYVTLPVYAVTLLLLIAAALI